MYPVCPVTDLPGLDRSDWSLPANIEAYKSAYSFVVLADADVAYEQGDWSVCAETSEGQHSTKAVVFPRFEPLLWILGDGSGVEGVAMVDCFRDSEGGKCVSLDGAVWFASTGRSLLFLGEDCCLERFRAGVKPVYRIYPVEGELVYDWDGTAHPLDEIIDMLNDAPVDETAIKFIGTCPPAE